MGNDKVGKVKRAAQEPPIPNNEQFKPGDHLCYIYESEDEHRALLTQFLYSGLMQGERVFYIVHDHAAETILSYLQQKGLDVKKLLKKRQLRIITCDDAYMRRGTFNPEAMIALLGEEAKQALAEGYTALRLTGEMSWALQTLSDSQPLIEYEAKLNQFFPGSKCIGLCQYDRRRFPPEVLLAILCTHPIVVIGTESYDNVYYMPPEKLSGNQAAELDRWITELMVRRTFAEVLRESKLKKPLEHDQKQAEEKLEERNLLQSIIDNLPDFIYVKDRDGKYILTNKAHMHFLGKKRQDEIVGKTIFELFPRELAEQYHHDDQHVIKTGEPTLNREEVSVDSAGNKVWNLTSKVPLRDNRGKIIGLIGIARDITERKRAEIALQELFESMVVALATLVELHDPYTAGHQKRVAEMACAIAQRLGLAQERIEGIRVAGLLHDIGKIVVPAEILNKPTTLSELEFSMIKAHPQVGHDILKEISFPWPVADMVLEHHERLDGSGYPQGLKGDQIMLEARILAVADVVEAMTSHRPYRPARSEEQALQEIRAGAGTLYDLDVVRACEELVRARHSSDRPKKDKNSWTNRKADRA